MRGACLLRLLHPLRLSMPGVLRWWLRLHALHRMGQGALLGPLGLSRPSVLCGRPGRASKAVWWAGQGAEVWRGCSVGNAGKACAKSGLWQ